MSDGLTRAAGAQGHIALSKQVISNSRAVRCALVTSPCKGDAAGNSSGLKASVTDPACVGRIDIVSLIKTPGKIAHCHIVKGG